MHFIQKQWIHHHYEPKNTDSVWVTWIHWPKRHRHKDKRHKRDTICPKSNLMSEEKEQIKPTAQAWYQEIHLDRCEIQMLVCEGRQQENNRCKLMAGKYFNSADKWGKYRCHQWTRGPHVFTSATRNHMTLRSHVCSSKNTQACVTAPSLTSSADAQAEEDEKTFSRLTSWLPQKQHSHAVLNPPPRRPLSLPKVQNPESGI